MGTREPPEEMFRVRNNRDDRQLVNPGLQPVLYWQVRQPGGHVGWVDVGVKHVGSVMGPSETQQS